MRNNILVASLVMALLLSAVSVSASVSSVTTSSSATSATTGTSVTITASITATGSESNSVTIITSPAGITVSDPSGGQYQSVSMSATPVSKTFTISAGAANTYSYYVTSGGTPSTTETISFVDPSTLTVSASPSSTTKTSGQSFTESITITNPSSSAVTTSYSLSCPSGFTCSGDPTSSSGITIGASSSTTLSWTITVGGTSASATVSLSVGDNSNAASTTVSCSDCATTTTTTTTDTSTNSATTTSQTKVSLQKGKATIDIPSITAGKSTTVNINKTEDVAFRMISITAKSTINSIQITVAKLDSKPSTITQDIPGKVYHYIQVDKNITVDTSINSTSMRFEVEKSWLSANNINKSTVALYRYENNAWNKLLTTMMSEDDTNVLYEATSPGLSVFAIGGEASVGTPSQTPQETQPAGNVTTGKEFVENVKKDSWKIVLVVIGFVAAVAALVFLEKKGLIKLPIFKKSNWDDLKRKYSKRN